MSVCLSVPSDAMPRCHDTKDRGNTPPTPRKRLDGTHNWSRRYRVKKNLDLPESQTPAALSAGRRYTGSKISLKFIHTLTSHLYVGHPSEFFLLCSSTENFDLKNQTPWRPRGNHTDRPTYRPSLVGEVSVSFCG
jgi:hypothetical protein